MVKVDETENAFNQVAAAAAATTEVPVVSAQAVTDDVADDELMKEMEQLKLRIEGNVKKRKTADEKQAEALSTMNAIFKIVYQMMPQIVEIKNSVAEFKDFHAAVNEEIVTLKQQNDYLYAQNEDLKKRVLKAEIQESRKAVIIKEFPFTGSQNGTENKVTLKNGFDKVLNKMGIKNDVKVDSIFRFQKKESESGRNDSKVAPLRVQFCSALDKDLFMANIKKTEQE